MDIDPASLPQIRRGRRGRVVFIDNDALGVAKQLQEIHPSLRLAWNELGEYFVVFQRLENGKENIVTTAQKADGRLVQRIREVTSPDYNIVDELKRLEAAEKRRDEHIFNQQVGEIAEKLAHAVRKDIQAKNRIFVPVNYRKSVDECC